MSYDVNTNRKWMKARKLAELLLTLGDLSVEVNRVGNLAITDEDGEFKGWIDFNGEEVEFKQ